MSTQPHTASRTVALTNEINVTPMIDVLLVLLIIFMAAIPSMRRSLDVRLPDPAPLQKSNDGPSSIVLELDASGAYSINHAVVAHGDLSRTLHEIYDSRPEKVLFVKGDRRVRYAKVIEAMDVARGSGVKVLGLP